EWSARTARTFIAKHASPDPARGRRRPPGQHTIRRHDLALAASHFRIIPAPLEINMPSTSILALTAGLCLVASADPAPKTPTNDTNPAAGQPSKAKPAGPGPIIASTGVLDRAKKVGDKAPDFKLPDAQGGEFDMKAARAKGPVVVT
ncbi:MAG: hypothetical protein ACK58T_36320, partial [Phycisphaerae bacterium]